MAYHVVDGRFADAPPHPALLARCCRVRRAPHGRVKRSRNCSPTCTRSLRLQIFRVFHTPRSLCLPCPLTPLTICSLHCSPRPRLPSPMLCLSFSSRFCSHLPVHSSLSIARAYSPPMQPQPSRSHRSRSVSGSRLPLGHCFFTVDLAAYALGTHLEVCFQ